MKIKTLCLLEHPEQYDALRQTGVSLDEISFYCATYETEALLHRDGRRFILWTDDVLKDEWDAINTWARKTSLEWFRDPQFSVLLTINGLNVGDALSRPISHALIYVLKAHRLIDKLLAEVVPERAIIFEDFAKNGRGWAKVCPSFNQILLRRLKGLEVEASRVPVRQNIARHSVLKEALRHFLTLSELFVPYRRCAYPYAGMGSLPHVFPVLAGLGRSDAVLFMDESLQLAARTKCRQAGIEYRLVTSFLSVIEYVRLAKAFRMLVSQISSTLTAASEAERFCYDGRPVHGAGEAILGVIKRRAFSRMVQAFAVGQMIKKNSLRGMVLHEDINACRAAALTAIERGCPVTVLSHGIPPTRCDWRGIASGIGVGDVIVNSEFEREKYILSGYDPGLLHVLGLPRFDRIYHRISEHRRDKKVGEAVLYCPHMLREFSKHQTGYLGVHTPGAITERYAIAVMNACRKEGRPLWIKLHDNQDISRWRSLVTQYGGKQAVLHRHDADIFGLLDQCGLVVTTFSTVIIEAMLYDLNVISMNFTGERDMHPYVNYGIALPARNSSELERAISDCFHDVPTQATLRAKRREHFLYFGGPFDGKNTERGCEFIRKRAVVEQSTVGDEPAISVARQPMEEDHA